MDEPVEWDHPILGQVQQWDDTAECEVDYEGQLVLLTIYSEDTIEPLFDLAVKLVYRLPTIVEAAKTYAAERLLKEHWLEGGAAPATVREFTALLTLNSIGIGDGDFSAISFDGGALFWDHYISVLLNSELEFTGTRIDG